MLLCLIFRTTRPRIDGDGPAGLITFFATEQTKYSRRRYCRFAELYANKLRDRTRFLRIFGCCSLKLWDLSSARRLPDLYSGVQDSRCPTSRAYLLSSQHAPFGPPQRPSSAELYGDVMLAGGILSAAMVAIAENPHENALRKAGFVQHWGRCHTQATRPWKKSLGQVCIL